MDIYRGLIPENDGQRLAALRAYNVLGASPDGVFDEMVRLTAKLFGVPVALISSGCRARVLPTEMASCPMPENYLLTLP